MLCVGCTGRIVAEESEDFHSAALKKLVAPSHEGPLPVNFENFNTIWCPQVQSGASVIQKITT